LHSQICCEIKIILTELRVRLWFFEYTYWNTQTKCMSIVLWGALTLPKPKIVLHFSNPIEQSKAFRVVYGGWEMTLNPFPGTKVPPEIGLSQMPTFTESCPSVNCQFPQCQVSIPNCPFLPFSFSFLLAHMTKPTRVVGFRVWWAFQLLIVFCVFETFDLPWRTSVFSYVEILIWRD
jgi:hypothetical protein